jgi:hypothetical protein
MAFERVAENRVLYLLHVKDFGCIISAANSEDDDT